MARAPAGSINAHEAYSKTEAMNRLGISQRFWDQMLANGLRYAEIGHSRWVTGQALIEYMTRHSKTKANNEDADNVSSGAICDVGNADGEIPYS
jgi:hypothetical protein